MGEKIGILGGTFDPPHLAHLIIAQEALAVCELDEVWFMPTNTPPHKMNEDMASSKHRAEMTKLAIATQPQFKLCSVELNRTGPSYSADTLEILKKDYPDASFYFIVGGDMALSLETWHAIDRLRKLVTFIVSKRPDYEGTFPYREELILVDVPQLELSSSDIRQRVGERRNIRYLVPERVRRYVEEQGLYERS